MTKKLKIRTRHGGKWLAIGTEVEIVKETSNKSLVRVPGCVETLQVFSCFLSDVEELADVITLPISIQQRADSDDFRYGERFERYLQDSQRDSERARVLVESFKAPRKAGMGGF